MISVLIPSRGRPELYARAVASLLDHASHPEQVEILARLDEDDYNQYQGLPGRLVVDIPLGYGGQHDYNNQLAELATGEWLMVFNDDALMQTQGWDDVIHEHEGFHLLSLDNNNGRQYACFPAVPRKWYEICGHLALDCRIDSWMQEVAHEVGCFVEENRVFILHDRHDLTGNNDDETYRATKLVGQESFYSQESIDARHRDALLLRDYLA